MLRKLNRDLGKLILGATAVVAIYFGVNFYIARRLYQAGTYLSPSFPLVWFIIVYTLIAVAHILGRLALPIAVKKVMAAIGSLWLGAFVYLWILMMLRDGLVFLARLAGWVSPAALPRAQFWATTVVVVLTSAIILYGIYQAGKTKIVSYDLPLRPNQSGELKIVLIADLHLGDTNSEARLEDIVTKINQQQADIVCIAGDIFNDSYRNIRYPDRAASLLGNLKTRFGVYACLGNHDAGQTLPEMMDFLERSNIRLLTDDYTLIDDRFVLVGRLDPSPIGGFGDLHRADFADLALPGDASRPVIVMDHNPAKIAEYGLGIDLILCGHTHHGQVFPANLLTSAIFPVSYGHYQKDSASPQVVVTSGVGMWGMPLRVGTHNEIVTITLR
jgi:predicted MPP superfamily phosphohydrolase